MSITEFDASELPIFPHITSICEMVANNRISIVCASTGSGKSSILPHALFEHTREPVVCTSPTVAATIGLYKRARQAFPETTIGRAYGGFVDYNTGSQVTYVTAGHFRECWLVRVVIIK